MKKEERKEDRKEERKEEREVRVNGRKCLLTRTEYDVYRWLWRHRGAVVSRGSLLRNVWGFPAETDTRSVDMCIRRLRTKIGSGAIRTVYGKGYVMN